MVNKDKANTEDDMIDAIAVIQEALIDLYLNVKVRSKDEINNYDESDLVKERENLYMTSPIDLITYIQTSVEILMNIKVEDYLSHKKDNEKRKKIRQRKMQKDKTEKVTEIKDLLMSNDKDARGHQVGIFLSFRYHTDVYINNFSNSFLIPTARD